MPSKETILAKIKANRPNLWPLPDVPIFETLATDKKKLFIQILERGGSKVHCIDDSTQIHQVLTTQFPEDKRMVSALPFLEGIEGITTLHPDFYHPLRDSAILVNLCREKSGDLSIRIGYY